MLFILLFIALTGLGYSIAAGRLIKCASAFGDGSYSNQSLFIKLTALERMMTDDC